MGQDGAEFTLDLDGIGARFQLDQAEVDLAFGRHQKAVEGLLARHQHAVPAKAGAEFEVADHDGLLPVQADFVRRRSRRVEWP